MPQITKDQQELAGYYLARQLEQLMPKVYRRKYAGLWAQADSTVITGLPDLDPGATSIVEQVVDERGEAKLMSDDADDIPLVEVSINENKYQVYVVALGYRYGVMQLLRQARSNLDINREKSVQTDRGIREKIHRLLLFGDVNRGTTGLYNDAGVPITTGTYDANTASWQDHIDFVREELARVSNRNEMTDNVDTMIIPNNLWYIWSTTYQTNDSGKTVIQAIRETLGQSGGGTLRQILAKNECRADLLEQFGVKAPGTDEDRIIYLPANEDAVDRMFSPMSYLEPQLRGLNYYVYAYAATTETMIHYPESCAYSDIPKVNPPIA